MTDELLKQAWMNARARHSDEFIEAAMKRSPETMDLWVLSCALADRLEKLRAAAVGHQCCGQWAEYCDSPQSCALRAALTEGREAEGESDG